MVNQALSVGSGGGEARRCGIGPGEGERRGALTVAGSASGWLVFSQEGAAREGKRPLLPDSRSPLLRLNTLCPYFTMFPLAFPLGHLGQASREDWVLDPFCGRGTTLFAARLLGLASVGLDCNPVAAAVAAAKLANVTPQAVIGRARTLLERPAPPFRLPEGEFWSLCFHPDTLQAVCLLRERLLISCERPEDIVLRALVLGLLHGPLRRGLPTFLSNQMPRTYATKPAAAVRYWRRTGKTEPPPVDVLDAIGRRARFSLEALPPPSAGAVYFADARMADKIVAEERRFRWVLTSPPYLGMESYRPDQWLRNWFLGGPDGVDYGREGQISHGEKGFVEGLAAVWRSVARRCLPGARLIIRFGSLPSRPVDGMEILEASLKAAAAGWRIKGCFDAGSARQGRRQADQFGCASEAVEREVDINAVLEG